MTTREIIKSVLPNCKILGRTDSPLISNHKLRVCLLECIKDHDNRRKEAYQYFSTGDVWHDFIHWNNAYFTIHKDKVTFTATFMYRSNAIIPFKKTTKTWTIYYE